MAATNKQVVLRRLVAGKPSLDDLELIAGPLPEPQAGEVLVRTIYLSLDPYMRGRMGAPEAVGEVMVGGVVGEVVASNAAGFEPGQLVCQYVGGYGWQSYGAVAGSQLRVLDPDLVPITTALGVVGMPGVTAYFGLLEVGRPVAGETVVVSAASGAVGAVVGQLARMKGCRAVGIAGSAEKCAYVVDELRHARLRMDRSAPQPLHPRPACHHARFQPGRVRRPPRGGAGAAGDVGAQRHPQVQGTGSRRAGERPGCIPRHAGGRQLRQAAGAGERQCRAAPIDPPPSHPR